MEIVDHIRELADGVQKLDNVDLYRKVLNIQAEVLTLASALRTKEDRINELEEQLRIGIQLVRDRNVYWDKNQKGEPTGDPYCSYCWETARLAIHLIDRSCPHCKTLFTTLPSHW